MNFKIPSTLFQLVTALAIFDLISGHPLPTSPPVSISAAKVHPETEDRTTLSQKSRPSNANYVTVYEEGNSSRSPKSENPSGACKDNGYNRCTNLIVTSAESTDTQDGTTNNAVPPSESEETVTAYRDHGGNYLVYGLMVRMNAVSSVEMRKIPKKKILFIPQRYKRLEEEVTTSRTTKP